MGREVAGAEGLGRRGPAPKQRLVHAETSAEEEARQGKGEGNGDPTDAGVLVVGPASRRPRVSSVKGVARSPWTKRGARVARLFVVEGPATP